LFGIIATATILAIAGGWGLLFWHVERARADALDRAASLVQALSRTLAQHVGQTLHGTSMALRSLEERRDSSSAAMHRSHAKTHTLMRQLRDANPEFANIALTDAQGRTVVDANAPRAATLDLSASRAFRALIERGGDTARIGPPHSSAGADAAGIPVMRPVLDDHGNFGGALIAMLRPAYLTALHHAFGVSGVTLTLDDGTLLTREGNGDAPARAEGKVVGTATVPSYPVIAMVDLDTAAALSTWRRETRRILGAAVAASALILALAIVLLRRVWRQDRMAEHLIEARLAAEAANRAKTDFLAHMSHELRTPLNAINGFSELMLLRLHGPLHQRYVGYARDVKTAGEHLLAIINNILDLAKVDSGSWEVNPEPVRLPDLARELTSLTAGRAEVHRVTLRVDMPDHLAPLTTDRRMLLQVLLNLTVNGIKFTPAGGSVRVSACADGARLAIEVADTGVGMSAADLDRVLRPFGRGSSEIARRHHDTGLGLPLSKRFVELLGGDLQIASQVDAGTRITVRLPYSANVGAARAVA